MEKSWYYVSLVRGLQGYYVAFLAPSEEVVREFCAKYMGRMWCSVYSEESNPDFCIDHNVINTDKPVELNESSDWE